MSQNQTTKPAPLPALPRAGRKATPKPCTCGCGGTTRGGRYIPGHDARQKGWAIRIAGGHDTTGITEPEHAAAIEYINRHPELKAQYDARIAATAQTDAA